MKLYTFWRSSAAYRVRIALNLKQIPYEDSPLHLVKNGGEHKSEDYIALNPQKLVPALVDDSGNLLTQSMAAIEYLEDVKPSPALLPSNPIERAHVRALSQAVSCDIHPLNNLRVLQYLTGELNLNEDQKAEWYHHWIRIGFEGVEATLESSNYTGEFSFGDTPSMADCCLIPQVYNARRFELDLGDFPIIQRIERNCLSLKAFDQAIPENQIDAE